MDPAILAILLGLLSAVTLAASNLSVKMGGDILVGRAALSGYAAILTLPALLFVPMPDAATWNALAWSIPAHFFYQLCLVQALGRGDLSLVFPLMRGTAPLLTAIAALLLLGERLAPLGWVGLLIATSAVILFAWPPADTGRKRHPHAVALFWAFGTGLGISLYNVADAYGVRAAPNPFTFIAWLFVLDGIPMMLTAALLRRGALASALLLRWRLGLAAALLSMLSFGSALYALSLIEAAKVSALRETAVVFAAAMGSLFLGETFGRRRIVYAAILAAGLVLMQFGG